MNPHRYSRLTAAIVVGLAAAVVTVGRAAAQSRSVVPSGMADGQVEALQNRMLNDPGLTADVTALRSDPEFKNILEDPEIIAALQSGNTNALLANPKVTKLLDNPKVQKITKELAEKVTR